MSGIANTLKNFRYVLELDGINSFLIQEVQLPTAEWAVLTHGAPVNIPDKKTPGKLKIGEMTVKKLKPAITAENWAWDWFSQGAVGISTQWEKTGFLKALSPDGFVTIESYFLGNVWCSKIEPSNFVSGGDGENFMETLTLQVQFFFPKSSPQFAALFAGSAAQAGGAGFRSGIGI